MKNPYRKNSHLSVQKTRQIMKLFCEDLTASTTSNLLNIERKTVNRWYKYFREVIYNHSKETDLEIRGGVVEIDESYFGARRVRGKRGRGASGKIKVLGLLKREGEVYVRIVPDCSAETLIPIIRDKVSLENSKINTDYWKSYDGLVDLGYKKHYRVIHSNNEFARGKQHINGIESFRSYCKRRLAKFNGIKKEYYDIYLKECEWRFNCGLLKQNKYKQLMKLCKNFTSSLG
ncbi:IS1595 family transposase [Candidatus Absconditicoccus praedator]|uniref:IS1595 family transposase n=1 Tax=Candidatus Absconditicoccus praedator TaxID=2735562 RepID=UPI001E44413C|nr:IS1595 family transposase [Candidatus Absconditicoccus praedator]UFX83268.1 IS1595 family transposase [Candidatus Absconditicoccus praedator]